MWYHVLATKVKVASAVLVAQAVPLPMSPWMRGLPPMNFMSNPKSVGLRVPIMDILAVVLLGQAQHSTVKVPVSEPEGGTRAPYPVLAPLDRKTTRQNSRP